MTDTTNALRELIEAAEGHLREYASGQRHNDEGRRYKATQRLRAAIAALATAQPEAKPEGVDTESADFMEGFAVGRAESEMLVGLLKDPKCARCGARNAKEAETLCRPSDDSCPGVEWPLDRIWTLATRQAQGGGEDGR